MLKGRSGAQQRPVNNGIPQKKYLIMTKLDKETKQKVHYPLPLQPLDTEKPHTLDAATMKAMIAKMARSMTNLKSGMNQSQSSKYSQFSNQQEDQAFVTARSFFSKDN